MPSDNPKPGPFAEPLAEPMHVSLLVVNGGPEADGTFFTVCVPEMCVSVRSSCFDASIVMDWLFPLLEAAASADCCCCWDCPSEVEFGSDRVVLIPSASADVEISKPKISGAIFMVNPRERAEAL